MPDTVRTQEVEGMPPSALKWNWGAFLIPSIWSLRHRVYFGMWCAIPLVGLALRFMLGAGGGRRAWASRGWSSEEDFKHTQLKWAIGGVVTKLLSGAGVIVAALIITGSGGESTTQKVVNPLVDVLGDGGRIQISVPADWIPLDEELKNPDSEIDMTDPSESAFVTLIAEPKEDFSSLTLDDYATVTSDLLLSELNEALVATGPDRVKVPGGNGIQYEIRGSGGRVRVVYLFTAIETPDHYVQLIMAALPSKFSNFEKEFRSILRSAREVSGPPSAV